MVFGTCHVKTRSGLRTAAPVYVCVGRSYAVFVIPADGNRQRPEFRTGKALLAVRVVTGGGMVAAKPHSHSVLRILDQVRAGKDCWHSAAFNRRQLWRTKGKTKRNQRRS